MRAKSLILFVIAVGCGLAASIGVSQYMENANSNAPQVETIEIFVALTDVNIGEKLDAQNVKLEAWPKDRVPEGAILDLAEIENKYPRTRLYSGEPILRAKLMDSNRGSDTVRIPKGYRAVAVKVSADTAGGGLIQPGDRVDVLVILRKSAEIPETGTRTILTDVNVFSVDGATERGVDEEGRARNLSTVSLLLKPNQAEALMLAKELGTLNLIVRRPDDDTEDVGTGETIRSLLGSSGESANETPNKSGGFTDWLNGLSKPPTQQAPAPTTPVSTTVVEKPAWEMEILGPGGTQKFHWVDEEKSPIEGGFGVTPAPALPAAPVTTPHPPAQLRAGSAPRGTAPAEAEVEEEE